MSVLGPRWPHATAAGWNAVDMPGLFVMAVLAMLLWVAVNVMGAPLLFPAATYRGPLPRVEQVSPACVELARLRNHGVARGAQVDRLRVACSRATGR